MPIRDQITANYGRSGAVKSLVLPVEEGEALDVKHVNLIDEQHPWDKLGDTLVDVSVHNLVDLL